MRCPGCDYPLWNLTARICPECGRPFAPSDFDFVANSVRFCCPHCSQDYYGTGPRGHLQPIEFDCAKCHNHIHMDQMVLLPTEGVKEEQTEFDVVPWLERARIGRFKAFFSTIGRAMFQPGRLARAMPEGSGVGPAWQFALVANLGYVLCGAFPLVLFPLAFAGGRAGGVMLVGMARFMGVMLAAVALVFLLWGLVAHAVLRVTGPTRLGTGASVRALCYASGANVITAIPCFGIYLFFIGFVWTAISGAIMLRTAHGVGWFRALLAASVFPLALVLCAAGWIALVVTSGTSYRVMLAQRAAAASSVSRIASALAAYRARHNDQFPPHAICLLQEGDLVGSDFTSLTFGSSTSQTEPMLTSFQLRSSDQQAAAARNLAASLPANTVAYRFGDVVFTYPGIDPASGDPGLWVAVMPRPDSEINDNSVGVEPAASVVLQVVTLGGGTLNIPRPAFAAALAKQNALRAPLPPLPDPTNVRAGQPATSP